MTAQSEPDGGVWQDRNGDQWRKTSDVWENLRDGVWLSWSDLCRDYGPLVPLIPDPGWEQDGEPVVCRVVWRDNENVAVVGPTGSAMYVTSATLAASYGLPLPPEPEPSLADEITVALSRRVGCAGDSDRALVGGVARELLVRAAARLRELDADDGTDQAAWSDLMGECAEKDARIKELEGMVESAGKEAYRVATMYRDERPDPDLHKAVRDYFAATNDTAQPPGMSPSEWWDDPKVQEAMARQDEAHDRMESIIKWLDSPNYQSATSESQSSSKLDPDPMRWIIENNRNATDADIGAAVRAALEADGGEA